MSSAPLPFRQFVVKVHSRCDLACDHCYIYEFADQSWRARPKVLSVETAALIGARIAEHAQEHGLERVTVVLHGGEPLLAGPQQLDAIAAELHGALDGVTTLDLRLHTNAVTLDERFCRVFDAHGIKVGVSLDGDAEANDRHRRYADGRSSHQQVRQALALLRRPEHRHLYAGILCTVDIANDPIEVYQALVAEQPPRTDLLLPHATWDAPPKRPHDPATGAPNPTAYADWLICIYDRWTADGRPIGLRLFESVESTLAGGPPLTEALGLAPSDLLTIETDGEIEQVDTLRISFDRAPATGLHIASDALDAAAESPGVRARQQGAAGLCAQCRACPALQSCGGGYYPHRYRSENGFDNPSVFCADLLKLVGHITESRRRTVTAPAHDGHTLAPALFDELASGFGGAAAVRALAAAQDSINRALLAEAGQRALAESPSLRPAWNLLVRLDREGPAEALAQTLANPYFRSWAVQLLDGGPDRAGAGHLAGIALAAAARAGAEAELAVPVVDGAAAVPGHGRFVAAGADHTVTVATKDGELLADPARARWEPTRIVSCDDATVLIEDTDPERDAHHYPVLPRLAESDYLEWSLAISAAWKAIGIDHAAHAPGLAAGLRAVTPLAPAGGGAEISATARHAFGAVAAAMPRSPELLALLLMHEFQHSKMGAVLDLYDLYDESDRRRFYAPWRPDPRPLEGLLQGTYAHIAVTDFWRVRRTVAVSAEEAREAETHFVRWRGLTAEAIEVLAGSGSLTALGLRFAEGMRRTVAPWLEEAVDPAAQRTAEPARRRHRDQFEADQRNDAAV
ncbi:MAG TPA: FxsB family cyclophane-forming radical SAM/SPASM peptide maturase [Actinocrinis sp.]|jgi:uncharacterized protein